MTVDCPTLPGRQTGVRVYASPTMVGVIILEAMDNVEPPRGGVGYMNGYLTVENEPVILVAGFNGGRIVSLCIQTGAEAARGDSAVRVLRGLLEKKATGLVELGVYEGAPGPEHGRLSKPIPRGSIEPKAAPAGLEGGRIESMDGIHLGMLMSEVILSSRLIAKSKAAQEIFRRARLESRKDRTRLYRAAFYLRDGSILNVFMKGGRIVRIIMLKPGRIEAELVRDGDAIRRILENKSDIEDASLYVVECPRCERLILGH